MSMYDNYNDINRCMYCNKELDLYREKMRLVYKGSVVLKFVFCSNHCRVTYIDEKLQDEVLEDD